MAQNNKSLAFLLIALIIFCQGFQSIEIEGRYLKSDEGENKNDVVDGGNSSSTTNAAVPPPPGRDVDDFRPTAPGHSPGVGHSIHN
ncbi:hypothetical protein SESBI_15389 [Sesbania bispinosa]|nr:hypothetical protein SESBI_15389 [Sesbania bispinosa]